jgi:hypothetical protein
VRSDFPEPTLNEVAVEALRLGLGAGTEPTHYRNLRDLTGTWANDPETEAALAEQDRVVPYLWE